MNYYCIELCAWINHFSCHKCHKQAQNVNATLPHGMLDTTEMLVDELSLQVWVQWVIPLLQSYSMPGFITAWVYEQRVYQSSLVRVFNFFLKQWCLFHNITVFLLYLWSNKFILGEHKRPQTDHKPSLLIHHLIFAVPDFSFWWQQLHLSAL